MSLGQVCAAAEDAIAHSRSLFGSRRTEQVSDTSHYLNAAADAVSTARARTVDLSGVGIESYQALADESVLPLNTATISDTRLANYLTTANAITQNGAARLDQIAACAQSIAKLAPMARSAASEKTILMAMRTQLSQASQVVQSTHQQATVLAAHTRALHYEGAQRSSDPTIQAAGFGTPALSPQFPQDPEPSPPEPGFGECFREHFSEDIGENMVKGVFVGGALGAVRGGILGGFGGPLGVLGGAVVGFVGGAAGGALISGPARTAATSAWDCR